MQRALVSPVLAHERTERVDVSTAERIGHEEGEPLEVIERATDLRIAFAAAVGHRGDGVRRDARLSRVDEHDPSRERGRDVVGERDALYLNRCPGGEEQRATEGGSVVILKSAGDAQLLDLGAAAAFGERWTVERCAGQSGERTGDCHASGRRTPESCAEREVTPHGGLRAWQWGSAKCRAHEGIVGVAGRGVRGRSGVIARHGGGGVARDGEVADRAAALVGVWRNVGPSAAEVETRRRAGGEGTTHGATRSGRERCASARPHAA